ncbi:TPA: hypothetical protein NJ328_003659 [Vibrio parahaemolyticus]|nr:hypothetical protein [Vibrio parahaemolyticus]
MSFNFKDSLETGQEAAANVAASRKEVSFVLDQLKRDLSEFLGVELELIIKDEIEYRKRGRDSKSSYLLGGLMTLGVAASDIGLGAPIKTGYKSISFKGSLDNKFELFQIKEGQNVFPLNVKSDVHKSIAVDCEELVEVIGMILENPKTHTKFRAFTKYENEF